MDYSDKTVKRLAVLLAVFAIAAVVALALRGAAVSDALKNLILPEVEAVSGLKASARQIYINAFPLFVEARDFDVRDPQGQRMLFVPRAKAYIDLSDLLARRIRIRRLVVKEAGLSAERKELETVVAHVKAYMEKESGSSLKVKVTAVELRGGKVNLRDQGNDLSVAASGLDAEVLPEGVLRVRSSAKTVRVARKGWPTIDGDADVRLSVKDGVVRFDRFAFGISGSRAEGAGEVSGSKGDLKTRIGLLAATAKKIFGLQKSGEGGIDAEGSLALRNGKVNVDMKIGGDFYLETLMELLHVKERLEGWITMKGTVKGPLDDLAAVGTATLEKGNVFDVDLESLTCRISYSKGIMKFDDGEGSLYNGKAKVKAFIHLPVVNYYGISAEFEGLDSKSVFGFIGWDPGIEPGKVTGSLDTEGSRFDPRGWFRYRSTSVGKNMIGRIRDISGGYSMKNRLLSLTGLRLGTGLTDMTAEGTADIAGKTLDINGFLKTREVTDLTLPYYNKLKGSAEFRGKITGSFSDPAIRGTMKILNPVFESYSAEGLDASFFYSKDRFLLQDMNVREKGGSGHVTGRIFFPGARELFDLSAPRYDLDARMNNADLGKVMRIFYPGFKGEGRFDSDCRIEGTADRPEVGGNAVIRDGSLYGYPVDSASLLWRYGGGRIDLSNVKIRRGGSSLSAEASLDSGGSFRYRASSDRLLLSDLVQRKLNGEATFVMKSEGRGTIDDPVITVDARLTEGKLRGKIIGTGRIAARIKDRDMTLSADLLNGTVHVSGKGRFENEIPWSASVDIQPGRYDSVVGAFLKDVPEDLKLTLAGGVTAHGDKDHIVASAVVKEVALSMYGYSFTNEKAAKLELHDRDLAFDRIGMKSGNTTLAIDGHLILGRQFNIVVEGSSDLSPVKSLSSKIGFLKGKAEIVMSVTGDWNSPQINGGVNMSDGAVSLKDYSYRLSSLKGYFFMDNDRIVIQRMSGKLGGGDIDMSGILYLKRFAIKRFYIEAALDNVTTLLSGDFSVNFGGSLLYKGTPGSRSISGDIRINRARYKERVEWKSWLLKTRKAERYRGEVSDFERTALNIKITGKNSIVIDNNVTRATVSADMVLRGSVFRPLLLGRLETREGAVYFRNIEFRVLHASADFTDTGKFNPYVNISAETEVKDYKIHMNIDGQLDHFTVDLSSEPALKEMDILSLLAVGQTSGEMKGLEGGIGASEATSFVTGKLQDVIEERMKTITGLDRFQIDPHVSKSTGSVEPTVTVSKRLLNDRMYVTYTSSVGSTEEQIVKLEYFLSKNMSLIGVRDERGIVGGDIRFRFDFK